MRKIILATMLFSASVYANDKPVKPEGSIWDKTTWDKVYEGKESSIFARVPKYMQKKDGLTRAIMRISYKNGFYDYESKLTYDTATLNTTYDCVAKTMSYGSTSLYQGNKNVHTTKGTSITNKMQPVAFALEQRVYDVVCKPIQ